jgi:hypothetical protein
MFHLQGKNAKLNVKSKKDYLRLSKKERRENGKKKKLNV